MASADVSCPICAVSLCALSERQREEHCDSCLDTCGVLEVAAELQPPGGGDADGTAIAKIEVLEESTLATEPREMSPGAVSRVNSSPCRGVGSRPSVSAEIKEESVLLIRGASASSALCNWSNSPDESRAKPALYDLVNESTEPPAKRTQTLLKRVPEKPEKPRARRAMPFYKVLEFGPTKVAVDAFNYGKIEEVQSYFLTHFHSDHYGGLSKTWAHGPIYCTRATARLVTMKLRVDPQFVIPVELNTEVTIDGVRVRFLDANHCPGAVVILFNDTVLHTGDFRANRLLVAELNALKVHLSTLYLDTTYLDPTRKFPAQNLVNDVCAELCVRQQARPARYDFFMQRNMKRRILVFVGTYTIGKERLAVSIARALRTKIWTAPYKRLILEAVDDPALLQYLGDREDDCQVVLASMGEISLPKLKAKWKHYHKKYTEIVGFVPTGWTWKSGSEFSVESMSSKSSFTSSEDGLIRVYKVPYSEHSSYAELEEFCAKVPCRNIIATVSTKNYDILRRWER